MDAYEPYVSLVVALAAGLLVGFERESTTTPAERRTFLGGARTHPLVALVGAVATLLAPALGLWPFAIAGISLFGLVVVSYAEDVRRGAERGITSEVALLLVFLLGCLAATRDLLGDAGAKAVVVLSIAVVATLLLSVKPKLHALVARASKADLYATLKFLIVAVVVLPLLPDRPMGPLDALNPRGIGLMVVLIAGIGFVGYLASRFLGPGRGVALTGLVGGLVSSTAVTLSFSARAREAPALARICALAVLLASTVMFPRILVEVAVVHPPLVRPLLLPFACAFAGGVAAGLVLFRGEARREAGADLHLENPFELSSALKWGAVFTLVLFLSRAASTYLGAGGSYLAGLLAGVTDVDAIALSMAALARNGGVTDEVAANTVLIGAAANTLTKAGLAAAIGRGALARPLLPAFGAVLAAAALGLALAP